MWQYYFSQNNLLKHSHLEFALFAIAEKLFLYIFSSWLAVDSTSMILNVIKQYANKQ